MAMVDADWSIDRSTGNIRYIGGDHDNSPSYATVIQFHRWLQDKADNASTTGDDELDITDTNPSERSTDNIIKLINGYNIDDRASEHLYDGSIIQGSGGTEVYYDGIVNFGNSGVTIQIIQNGKMLADDWWNLATGVGINEDTTQGISHRFMIKTRSAGSDIDSRKLLGITREFGNTFAEFPINGTARGNNVLALSDSSDLNNGTAIGTVAGWSISNTNEGYNNIQVEGDGVDHPFYSAWDRGSQSINDLYEFSKWMSKEPVTEDNAADTGTDANYVVDNGTITGQAQGFDVGGKSVMVTKVRVKIKIGAGTPTTGNLVCDIFSDSAGAPNASVATSENVAAASIIDSTNYEWTTFEFTGTDLVELTASTKYHIVITHADGSGTDYFHIEGDSAGGHTYDKYENNGGWSVSTGTNLYFDVFTAPEMYGLPASIFRGVTHEVQLDSADQSATDFSAFETVTWTGGSGQMLAIDDVNAGTAMWIQLLTGTVPGLDVQITGSTSTATTNTHASNPTEDRTATITQPFLGATTGSAIIGGYGAGVEYADLTQNDTLFDLDASASPLNPPNNVTFTITGVDDDSYILVAPRSGVDTNGDPAIDVDQMSVSGAIDNAAATSITVSAMPTAGYPDNGNTNVSAGSFTVGQEYEIVTVGTTDFTAIGAASNTIGEYFVATGVGTGTGNADTVAGTIRVAIADGSYKRIPYASISGTTITFCQAEDLSSGSSANVANGANIYFSYIDRKGTDGGSTFYKQVHDGSNDENTVIVVRDGHSADGDQTPTKQYIAAATWSSSDQSTGAILTSDE